MVSATAVFVCVCVCVCVCICVYILCAPVCDPLTRSVFFRLLRPVVLSRVATTCLGFVEWTNRTTKATKIPTVR